MNAIKILEEFLIENTSKLAWTEPQKQAAAKIMLDISKANGGEILEDTPISAELGQQFVVQRALDAVQRRLNDYARVHARDAHKYFKSHPVDQSEDEKLTRMHHWRPMIEINEADVDQLESLPEIGPVLAERISEHRDLNGPFASIEALEEVKGIDTVTTQRLKDFLYVRPAGSPPHYVSVKLAAFSSRPNLETFTALLAEGGGFSKLEQSNSDPVDKLIAELASILRDVRQNEFILQKHLPMTRASRIVRLNEIEKKADDLESQAVSGAGSPAGLLFDRGYFEFVKKLLQTATKSVRVKMFYMRYDKKGKDTPSDQLVDALLDAKKRGLEVQVILDRDRQGDVFKSRLINHNAYEALKKAGVDVVFDERGRANHTKLVLVDDTQVVAGSHNWTSGSLKNYDDTSLYISSKALAEKFLHHFKTQYQQRNAA